MRQLQAGVNRDNIESLQAREESKKLKSKMGDFGRQLADLEAEVRQLYGHIFCFFYVVMFHIFIPLSNKKGVLKHSFIQFQCN